MRIRVGCDVNRINIGVEQGYKGWGDGRNGESFGVRLSTIAIPAPDGGRAGLIDCFKPASEAGSGATWTDDAESDE